MAKCLWCGGFLNANLEIHFILSFKPFVPQYLCDKCTELFIQPTEIEQCCECGRFQGSTERCQDCEKWSEKLVNIALYPYHGIIKEYLDKYKFKGDYRLRHLFRYHLQKYIDKTEIVVPIPVSTATMQKRHFNQVTGILEDIDYVDCLLAKNKTHDQSEKGRQGRLELEQPFQLKPEYLSKIKGKKIVLIDDVYTTGTTLHHAAKLMQQNGVKTVRSITLAR
ncbi:ComF family protein [Fructilactobacillus sp. Tb1]|uniref:ComF family protein n=1 Tax=Fructilactobacillus sp. Tb1 TaxID=3422304 RepID=UPI003D2C4262